ncbi:TauD/TfdA family dioxygenase, partial [Alphaproteobacteria bacterium]|nr:TauD/TfdA family dioxygenase [Alphaproteobacteria bacterium]
MGLSLKPISDAIGVEALGIDLNRPIAVADAQALRDALAKHLLLIIRDQSFSPEQFVEAASVFGEPTRQHQSTLL